MFIKSTILTAALGMAVIGTSQPAAAQSAGYRTVAQGHADDRAFQRGYNEGREQGAADAGRHLRLDYGRHTEYRRADGGYNGHTSRGEYRQLFRRGFINGYTQGYNLVAEKQRGSAYYKGPGLGVLKSQAADIGFRDGYDQGRSDARGHARFDPRHGSRYRAGDHDWQSRFGPRDVYRQEYRVAFEQGYEDGYRDVRR